jgi:L-lactate utilization protein LutB
MDNPIGYYWNSRLKNLSEVLEANNFDVFIAETALDAKEIVTEKIIPELAPASISWGGSMTFTGTGLYEHLVSQKKIAVIDPAQKDISPEEKLQRRRNALLVDLYFTGTNAITENGLLVNLDMIGNRVAALTFGPKNVVVLVGRNKITADLEDAMIRIKDYAAPVNAIRLDMKTPCVKTSECQNCSSPQRICNTWTVTEKSFPNKRVKVILINQEMGL